MAVQLHLLVHVRACVCVHACVRAHLVRVLWFIHCVENRLWMLKVGNVVFFYSTSVTCCWFSYCLEHDICEIILNENVTSFAFIRRRNQSF
jgi:hypothetical protein